MFSSTFVAMNYKKIGIAIGMLLLCVIAGYFIFRNSILQWAFNRAVSKAANTYHLQLSANKVAFTGFDVVSVDGITLQPQGADTLLQLKHVRVNVALLSLLKGSIAFDGIEADSGALTICNFKDSSNIKFAKRASADTTQVSKGEPTPYNDIAKGLYKQLNYALSTSFDVSEMHISYADSGYTTQVYIPSMNYDRKNLSALIINLDNSDTLTAVGEVLQKGKRYSYTLNHTGKAATYLAFLNRPEGPKFNFNTIQGEVQIEPGSEFRLTFNGNATNLHMYHWRLAQEDVVFDKLQGSAVINITDDKVELDSASTLTINSTPVKLFAQYQRAPQQVLLGHAADLEAGRQAVGELDQHFIANLMAVAIVDLLEVVDVEQGHTHGRFQPARARQLALEVFVQALAVERAGQGVVAHLGAGVLQLLLQPQKVQGALQQRTAQQHLKSSVQALSAVGQLLTVLVLVIAACRGGLRVSCNPTPSSQLFRSQCGRQLAVVPFQHDHAGAHLLGKRVNIHAFMQDA